MRPARHRTAVTEQSGRTVTREVWLRSVSNHTAVSYALKHQTTFAYDEKGKRPVFLVFPVPVFQPCFSVSVLVFPRLVRL
jgi:hypothetical protein